MWIGKFNDFPSLSRFYQQKFRPWTLERRKKLTQKHWWKIVSSFHLVIAREKFDPREISNCVSGRASLQLGNKTAGWRAHKNILCREISTRRERESPNHEHKLEFCYGLDFVERKNFNAVSLFFCYSTAFCHNLIQIEHSISNLSKWKHSVEFTCNSIRRGELLMAQETKPKLFKK